jgi:hypothetical protein
MDEEILKEMAATLRDIKERLALGPAGAVPGSVTGWQGYFNKPVWWDLLRGPVADPQPEMLLDKAKLAQLKVHRLDAAMSELQKGIDSFKLERDLLKKEYQIK